MKVAHDQLCAPQRIAKMFLFPQGVEEHDTNQGRREPLSEPSSATAPATITDPGDVSNSSNNVPADDPEDTHRETFELKVFNKDFTMLEKSDMTKLKECILAGVLKKS